jgi:hypothetical protein
MVFRKKEQACSDASLTFFSSPQLTCAKLAIIATLKTNTPKGSNLLFPAGYVCLSLLTPIAREVPRMINVDRKSRAESTNDATREIDDEDRTAKPLETRRIMFIEKFTVREVVYQQSNHHQRSFW